MNPPIRIPPHELHFTYSRSGGPGGQNVNKVSSKVLLRWNVLQSQAFGFEAKAKIMGKLAPRLTKEHDLLITSQRFRDQGRNQADCLAKLVGLLTDALRPTKVRRPTKPTQGSKVRRVETKRKTTEKKASRRPPMND